MCSRLISYLSITTSVQSLLKFSRSFVYSFINALICSSVCSSIYSFFIRYDIPLLQAVQAAVTVPVIASSGAGKGVYCTVLHCTVLYCTVPYCTVLYCTPLSVLFLLLSRASLTTFEHHISAFINLFSLFALSS